jgi:hypothetical protein
MESYMIEQGDYIRDPMSGEIRKVSAVWHETIYFEDGGVMGADEAPFDVLLPSEVEG